MADDFARSVQILVSLSGNIENQLSSINQMLDKLSGKKININSDSINQFSGSAKNAANSFSGISNSAKDVEKQTSSSLKTLKGSIEDVDGGVQKLVGNLAGMAIGGSIAGFSYVSAAQTKIATEQIYKSIEANKKWKISKEEVEDLTKNATSTGYIGSSREMLEGVQTAGLTTGLKGQKLLDVSNAAAKLSFSTQEAYSKDMNDVLRMVSTSRKTLRPDELKSFAGMLTAGGVELQGGVEDSRLKDVKQRQKLLIEASKNLNMKDQVDARPWVQAADAMDELKKSIGEGLVPIMVPVIKGFTTIINLIKAIPGAPALIGLAAVMLTMISTIGALNSVLGPGIVLTKTLLSVQTYKNVVDEIGLGLTKARTVAEWMGIVPKQVNAVVTAELAAETAGLSGAIGMEAVGFEMETVAASEAAAANTGLAISEGLVLSPLLLIAIPLIALIGILALVESRTHVFSKALDRLAKSQLGQDLIQWFKDVSYWIGVVIDTIGQLIDIFLTGELDAIDNFYKWLKGTPGESKTEPTTYANNVPVMMNNGQVTGVATEEDKQNNPITSLSGPAKQVTSHAMGGYASTEGLTYVHPGEPIIAANVANSSSLQDKLQNIASGSTVPNDSSEILKILKNNIPLMQVNIDIIAKAITWIKNLLDTEWNIIIGIYSTLTKGFSFLVSKFKTLPTDIANAIKGFIGIGGSNATSPAIPNTVDAFMAANPVTKDTTDNKISENAKILAAQLYPDRKSEDIQSVANAIYDYMKAIKGGADENTVQRLRNKLNHFTVTGPASSSTSQSSEPEKKQGIFGWGNTLGFLAEGGSIQKSGLVYAHTGEPIIPAKIAGSSRLQDILESIAYGSSSTTTNGDINVRINYSAPTGTNSSSNMIVMDKISFERMVADVIAQKLRQLNGY